MLTEKLMLLSLLLLLLPPQSPFVLPLFSSPLLLLLQLPQLLCVPP